MDKPRRRLIAAACGAAALGGCAFTLEHGLLNPCGRDLPRDPAIEQAILDAWNGIDPAAVWDCHAHLGGDGDSASGIWLHPAMASFERSMLYAQRLLYLNAACTGGMRGHVDDGFVTRLLRLLDGMQPGVKVVLLAMDWYHTEHGEPSRDTTAVHVPNDYAMAVASRHPQRFEWAASIHPYRADCVGALRAARAAGARAIKWLPPTMGIDPGSARCDAFYAELARLGLPLITHAGRESAVHFGAQQDLGNPLRLRRALDQGVRVVGAHCATLGKDRDIDRGEHGPYVDSFTLFARLMDDARYGALLHGDLSAIAQVNRAGPYLAYLLARTDWHPRLLNGSDYPLPGVMPIHSMSQMVRLGILDPDMAPVLAVIRERNSLLFDFVLKRHLRLGSIRLPNSVFETRAFFENAGMA